jgi:hypothetical protein
LEEPAPKPEIDRDIGKDGPSERRRRREHRRSLHHEEHAQEERQQAGYPKHHTPVEGVAVDHVLVGARLPEADLGKDRIAELGHVGDDGARVEGDAEDVGFAARQALGGEALARRHRAKSLRAEIRPDQAGADQAEVRNDQ